MAQQQHSRKRTRQAPQPAARPAEMVIDLTGDDASSAPALAPAHALDGFVLPSDSEDERTLPQRRRRPPSPAEDADLQAHARQQAHELEAAALRREPQVRALARVAASHAQWQHSAVLLTNATCGALQEQRQRLQPEQGARCQERGALAR